MSEPVATTGYLAGMCGFDDPDWVKVIVDEDGYLLVDVVDSGGSDLQDVVDAIDALAAIVQARATAPTIYNKTMTLADTEYSQALPANTKKFTVKCRGEYDVKLCFTESGSGTTYITIPSQQSYWEDGIVDASITLYFQCATAAQVLEIVAWA